MSLPPISWRCATTRSTALEHATFLVFGIAVWMALLGPLPKPAWFSNCAKLLYIVAVRLIGTVLANVFIFSGTVFYPYYLRATAMAYQPARRPGLRRRDHDVRGEHPHHLLFAWLFMKVAGETEERQRLLDYAGTHGIALSEPRAARAVSAGRSEELRTRILEKSTT